MSLVKVVSRSRIIQLLILLLVCGWFATYAQPARAETVVTADQLTKWLKPLMQFQADFIQRTFDELGVLNESSEGHMSIARPDRFLWNYKTPFEQIILADGQQFWIYDIDMEQITVRPLDKATDSLPSLLLSGEVDEILQKFEITAHERSRSELPVRQTTIKILELLLAPREKTAGLKMIRLQLKRPDLEPIMLELFDEFDRSTQFVFRDYQWLKPNELNRFEMKVPDNVDVVGHPQ